MSALPAVGLLGVDSPIGLTIMRELGSHGVPVVAIGSHSQSLGRHSRYASKFAVRPPGPIAGWLDEFATEHGFARLMAVSETDLLQLASIKQLGNTGVQCAVPDLDKLQLVLDKSAVTELAGNLGIRVPRTWTPTSPNIAELDGIEFPVAVKWSDPNAVMDRLAAMSIEFIKVEYAHDPAQLEQALRKYDALGRYPIVQQYCAGYGLGQMFHMQDGAATLKFQHRRLREWPLSGGVSSYCESLPTEANRNLMVQSQQLLNAIGWQGPAMVEYKFDAATGTAWLMEINGRFWGSQALASAAGAHFGRETYRHAFLPDQQIAGKAGWRMRRARYAAPELKNLLDVGKSDLSVLSKIGYAAKFFAGYLNVRTRWYVWSWRDPAPFIYETAYILKRFLQQDRRPPAHEPRAAFAPGKSAETPRSVDRDRANGELAVGDIAPIARGDIQPVKPVWPVFPDAEIPSPTVSRHRTG